MLQRSERLLTPKIQRSKTANKHALYFVSPDKYHEESVQTVLISFHKDVQPGLGGRIFRAQNTDILHEIDNFCLAQNSSWQVSSHFACIKRKPLPE